MDVENNLDYAYAAEVWGDFSEKDALIFQPQAAEAAFDMAEKGINSGFDLIIFDSIAAIAPTKELEGDMKDWNVGLAPRRIAQFLRRNSYNVRNLETTFVFTNQVRANIGSYYGGYTTPGGYAIKHHSSLRVYVSRGKDIEEKLEGKKEVIGNLVNFVIKKNKVGMPHRQAKTNIIYGKGIDTYRDIISFATLLGVIKMRGAYTSFEDETIGLGISKSVEVLKNEPERLDKIIEMCYNVAGVRRPRNGLNGKNDNHR